MHIGGIGKDRAIGLAAGGLCCLVLLSSAIASPPLGSAKPAPSSAYSAQSILVASRSFVFQQHASTAKLDLRLPGESRPTTNQGATAALASGPFPSAFHHLDLGKTGLAEDASVRPLTLGTADVHFQEMSPAEIFARRVHQEGLPIARLWETKSALLSIGLNNKGKPGLWLTQKVH